MKRTLIASAAVVLATASGLAGAASWSVVVQPGVYGRVAIGGYAEAPVVVMPQPIVAVDNGYGEVVEETVDPAYATDQTPVYLWVPEYQRRHWAQYCREYGAYGVPVYFVDDGWYRANVMRRNWTPEQRSWSQQQWLEQDRLARDRMERQRFEQQRYEQQQRWNDQRAWRDQQQRGGDPRGRGGWDHDHDRDHDHDHDRDHYRGGDHDRGGPDSQNRMRWGSAPGFLPQQGQGNAVPRPQPGGGQWQQPGGQWQQAGSQWTQNGSGNGNGNGNGNVRGGVQGPQPPAASQPRGGSGHDADRRGDGRGQDRGDDRGQDRGDRRGPGDARGAYEHGRDARRDR